MRFFKKPAFDSPIDKNVVLLSRSCFALKLICETVAKRKQRKVTILFPDFFCGETLNALRDDNNVILQFYSINDEFEPEYSKINLSNSNVDLFVFVHFFGMYLNIAQAREFCNNIGSVLIEDCAHVLYPKVPFGTIGDYAIFSPHKCLPIVDGAMLKHNECANKEDWEEIKANISSLPRFSALKQYAINFGKNIFAVKAQGTYNPEAHYDARKQSETPSRISYISERILLTYSYDELVCYEKQRMKNLELLETVMRHFPVKSMITNEGTSIPYFGYFMIVDVANAQRTANTLKTLGLPLGVWSYLPYEVKATEITNAENFSTYCFSVPLHQYVTKKQIMSIVCK